MRRLPQRLMAVAGLSVVMLASACTGNDEPDDDEGATGEPDQVTYLTGFGTFGRNAYPWCAAAQGFFEQRNIEVQIEPGTGTGENLALVLGGQAQFTSIDIVGSLILLGQGTGGWKAIAAEHQTNQSSWITLDPELQTAEDLEGRTVGAQTGGVTDTLFPTYLQLAGADPDQVTVESVGAQDLPAALASGQVDAIGNYVVGQGAVRAAAEGREVFVHPYSEVLTDLYGSALVASDELIASDPDLVQRFSDALLEGMAWSHDNPDECAQIQTEAVDGSNFGPEAAAAELAISEPYVRVGNTPIGVFDESRVARMIATLEASGAIPAGITPQDIIAFDLLPEA